MNTVNAEKALAAPSIALPAVLTIEAVEILAAEFKQLVLENDTHLQLDASAVERVTTPGIQLIVSLEKTVTDAGGILDIIGGKEEFNNAFADVGLASLIQ